MKAITFLGAAKAWETVYVMPDGREHTAPFFGAALARFYPDLSMRVFVTEKARAMHLETFQALVEDYVGDLEPVAIPDGANEEELWQLFQTVVDEIEPQEQVLFDITHGFRSLPFLSFLAAAYLRTVKDIQLEAVLYGNFEARDTSVTPNRAPVIDLTRFVELFDWMTAADRFIRFGDGRDLAAQLDKTKPDHTLANRAELSEWCKTVGKAATALSAVSTALRLIRPEEAMAASAELRTQLVDATSQIGTHARPFQPLSRQVIESFLPVALDKTQIQQNPVQALAVERDLVHWYLKRNQLVQAVAVAREWIVSWAMLHLGHRDLVDKEARSGVENLLGRAVQQQRGGQKPGQSGTTRLSQVSSHEIGTELYSQLGNLRNDILHAGKRRNAMPARTVEKKVRELCEKLDELPLPNP